MGQLLKNIEDIRKIPVGEKFICMFSGGKDCGLALSKAISNGCIPVALIHCLSEPNQLSLFHNQDYSLAKAQADAMGIPLKCIDYKWWKDPQKTLQLFKSYKSLGVTFVLYGDLSIDSIVENHIYLCNLAGLNACVPLFHMDYNSIIEDMSKRSIVSIISAIDPVFLDKSWLGKKYDINAYNMFSQQEIDPLGENGEFHTTLINADFFNKVLQYNCNVINDNFLKIYPI